ncbi:NACHT and WD domain protein [Coniochaeta sp. 2T2.1]|nr:NACHT and WD domain protein [Coniochaeta sp. 2T2.1]
MLALQDSMYSEVSSSIKEGAIIFLGTPHRGSDSASTLHRVLSATVGSKAFVQELMANSTTLMTINEDFRHHAITLRLWSFYETKPTSTGPGRSSIIVDRNSAVLGYENEGSCHMDADHHTICKFATTDDSGYKDIKGLLLRLMKKTDSPERPRALQQHAEDERSRTMSYSLKHLAHVLGQEDTSEDDLLFFRESRIVGYTCEWIREKESFQWWRAGTDGSEARYLWLKAPPAVGKSVLMSFVVDQLHAEGENCAYYFFRVHDAVRRTTRAFLLSIIAQIARQNPEFCERLLELDEDHTNIHSMTTRLLWQKVFVDTLFKLISRVTYHWVVDGLDEADKPGEVLSFMGKIPSRAPIRVLIASRAGMELERDFQKLKINLVSLRTALREESIRPQDTRQDMRAHIDQQLESLPFDLEDREAIVSLIVDKSQGIFLWVNLAVDEILATVHTIDGVQEALDAIPSEMEDFLLRILDEMSTKLRDSNKRLAKAILQHTICAIRPLKTAELQATLEPEFGRIVNMEYTIKTVCPHLLRVEETTTIVQPIHATVREYLLQSPDSEFAIDGANAHGNMTKICLEMWNQDVLGEAISSHIRSKQRPDALDRIHPLLRYSSQSWFEHLFDADIDKSLLASLASFLRTRVLFWIEAVGLLDQLRLLTAAAKQLEQFVLRCPLISHADRRLVSGWAVDLIRIVPKFGKNITAYPFSIHKLIPPFCPRHTCIGSQFGESGDIAVVGTVTKKWDDCLAHITVGRDGEQCKSLAVGNTYLAVGLSDGKGTVVLYLTDTCEEFRRISHGERINAMALNSTGDLLVTGGYKLVKIWDIKSGEVLSRTENEAGTRCLALGFRSDNLTVLSVSSNDTLTIWNIEQNEQQHVRFVRPSQDAKYRGAPWGVTIDHDGARVALAYKGWPLEVWDIDERQLITTLSMRNPFGSCFQPINGDIYGVDEDGTVMHRDADLGHEREIDPQSHILACNPSGTLLAAGNGEGCLKIYTSDSLQLLYKLDKYDDSITGLAFSPDGARLYDIRYSDCNIWVPEILLVNLGDYESSSDESEASRTAQSTLLESAHTLQNITAIACDPTGEYICSGKGNGRVAVYDTKSGRQLQVLYKHAPTVHIETLVWSVDGLLVASGDDSGRVIVASLPPRSSAAPWNCRVKLDFRLDIRLDRGVRQLLMSPKSDRLLVATQRATSSFLLSDGSVIGARHHCAKEETPCWITHPIHPTKLIMLGSEHARIFDWDTFTELSGQKGIALVHDPPIQGKPWQFQDPHIKTQAYANQDGKFIVSGMAPLGERSVSTKCSFWDSELLVESAEIVTETRNLNDVYVDGLVGVYKNRVVFLDRELWVCTDGQDRGSDLTRHFYVPLDWLNTSEDRPSMMTPLGDFVYAKHGEVIVVKKGMKARQEVEPNF